MKRCKTKEVEDHLISAAQRGVDVRVVISPSHFKNDSSAIGRDKFKKSGVKVQLVNKLYIHAKILIADGLMDFVGLKTFHRHL
jgi:phosphatidylserine/phosphatidylglycerophosphate/cardiolipin synthase-like enzyme